MATKYKLIYFDSYGTAERIRYIFAYANKEYEDVRVNLTDWPALKPNTPFGKLPVLEIDGIPIAQSNAIARYLAKQFGLAGKDDRESLECDVLVDNLKDLFEVLKLLYTSDEEKKDEMKKELHEQHFPFYLEKFNKIATDNSSGLLVGSEITWADLTLAQFFDFLEDSKPGTLKPYPALESLVKKIHSAPGIKTWLEKRPVDGFKLSL